VHTTLATATPNNHFRLIGPTPSIVAYPKDSRPNVL
jgi:hypothetical protein